MEVVEILRLGVIVIGVECTRSWSKWSRSKSRKGSGWQRRGHFANGIHCVLDVCAPNDHPPFEAVFYRRDLIDCGGKTNQYHEARESKKQFLLKHEEKCTRFE